jgi:hypothetical protein
MIPKSDGSINIHKPNKQTLRRAHYYITDQSLVLNGEIYTQVQEMKGLEGSAAYGAALKKVKEEYDNRLSVHQPEGENPFNVLNLDTTVKFRRSIPSSLFELRNARYREVFQEYDVNPDFIKRFDKIQRQMNRVITRFQFKQPEKPKRNLKSLLNKVGVSLKSFSLNK